MHTVRENVEDVDVTSLQPRCLLGEGFFGKVWLVTDHENRKFALKKLSKFELLCEDQVHAVHREKQILLQLHHPGIVQLHAAYQDASHLYLLQPFLPGGDLFSLWQGAPNAQLPEAQVQFYAACLIDALWYMHSSQKIVYRDLKPENIVIDGAGYPVLVDFGHAKRLEPSQHDSGGDYQTFTLCGTAKYLSPEVVQGSGHSFAADYWSLGVVVYELLSGENPFEFWPGMDELALYGSIARADYLALPEGLVQPAEQQQQPALADLIDGLLTKDPARRLGALETVARNEVLEHEWLQGMDVWALRRRAVPAPWVPTAAGDSVDNSASYNNNVDHNPRLTQQQPHQQQQHDGETDDKDDSLASENNPPLTAKEQALFADFDSC